MTLLAWGCGAKFHAVEPEETEDGGSPGTEVGGDTGSAVGGSLTGGRSTAGGASGAGGKPVEEAPPPGGAGATPPVGGSGDGGASDGGSGDGGKGGSSGGGKGGMGGSGGADSSPIPLDGLELWFDARVGVTQSEGAVSGWKDRSRNERHAYQFTKSAQPVLVADGLSGKPALTFDGVDDWMSAPALPGDFTAGVTLITVGRTDGTDCMAYFEASNGPEVEDIHLGFWEKRYLYEVATRYLSPPPEQVLGQPEVVVGVHRPTVSGMGMGDVELRRNGKLLEEDQFPLPVVRQRDDVFLGRTHYASCTTLKGRIGEVLVYSRGLSPSELSKVEAHLQQKWGCCTE